MVPALHALQEDAPREEKNPAGQEEHSTARAPLNVPAGQVAHVPLPWLELNVPASQSVHDSAPIELARVPGAQLLQLVAPLVDENLPTSHATHPVRSALITGPLGQNEHAEEPGAENIPAGHPVQEEALLFG